jgi:hypothetical protein
MEHFYEVTGGRSPIRRLSNQPARELKVPSFTRALIFQAIGKSDSQAHNLRGELAAPCVAVR